MQELGAASQVTNGKAILALEPWLDGSARYQGAIYRSGGIFYPGANGEALFRFVLQNVEGGSSLSYIGRLSDAGRQISYSISRRDKNGKPLGHTGTIEWRLDKPAE